MANIRERRSDGGKGVQGGLLWNLGMALMLIAASWVSGVTGCAGPTPLPPAFAQPMEQAPEFVIGVADELQVTVWKNPELSVGAVPVRPDGMISLPLVGDVEAAGHTAMEMQEVIGSKLVEYVENPNVTVVVVAIHSRQAFVMGAVVSPGVVPLSQDMRVLDAISSRGGFNPYADQKHIQVIRNTPEGPVEFIFDYKAYIKGKAPQSNVLLQPGDTIVVPD